MIIYENGRWRSERTPDERQAEVDKILSTLSAEEIASVKHILDEMEAEGTSETADACASLEWDEIPIPIEEWLESEYHIGDLRNSIYPVLKRDMIELFSGNYHEVIMTGSTRYGKDFFATTCLVRILYELNCLRDPPRSMGLGAGEMIHIIPISKTTQAAKRIVFTGIKNKLMLSPWFRGRYKETMDYISFPNKNIMIVGGDSSGAGALGMNTISAIIDEGNFLGQVKASDLESTAGGRATDRAQMICDSIARRIKGTYKRAGVNGMLFILSSKRATEDFTERRLREHMQKQESGVFVRDYCVWLVRPEPFKRQKWHRCVISSAEGRCRVLDEDEPTPPDADVFEFPEDFLQQFRDDPAGCLTGDTLVPLLDGRVVPIKALVGLDEFWVYSCDADGRIRPGRGYDARLTRKDADIYEVLLDNGGIIRCTGNHPFMMHDGSYREARSLTSGVSVMPFDRKLNKLGYEILRQRVDGKWLATHQIVARECNDGAPYPKGIVIHHVDFNKLNNLPSNLRPMGSRAHIALHSEHAHMTLHTPAARAKQREAMARCREDPAYIQTITENLKKGSAAYSGSEKHRQTASRVGKQFGFGSAEWLSPERRAIRSENGTRNFTALNKSEQNPAKKAKNREAASLRLKSMDADTRRRATYAGLHSRHGHPGPAEGCPRCDGTEVIQKVIECAERRMTSKEAAACVGLSTSAIYYLLQREGLPTYKNLPGTRWPPNHKVVSVTKVGVEDVYDISVERWHNFAVDAGVFVHNSMRDIAGIALDTYSPFIANREAIDAMFEEGRPHLFGVREWETDRDLEIKWDDVMVANERGDPVPVCCPRAMRHAHLDLSKNLCASGICIAHQAGMTEVIREDKTTGKKAIEEVPVFHIDGMLRVLAAASGEIEHEEIRNVIYRLTEGGMNIRSVSMDHWMGVPNQQIFKKRGYRVEEISTVKKIDPYETARSALYEGRIKSPRYDLLRNELRVLELDPKRPVEKPRVIVPQGFTKDLADAFAGAIFYLAKYTKGGEMLAPSHGQSEFPRGSGVTWNNRGDVSWGDEEDYDSESGNDAHSQSWII